MRSPHCSAMYHGFLYNGEDVRVRTIRINGVVEVIPVCRFCDGPMDEGECAAGKYCCQFDGVSLDCSESDDDDLAEPDTEDEVLQCSRKSDGHCSPVE